MDDRDIWPSLPLADWQDTRDTLHTWMQIVGKTQEASMSRAPAARRRRVRHPGRLAGRPETARRGDRGSVRPAEHGRATPVSGRCG
jgi:Family of unknown function (DUF5996)